MAGQRLGHGFGGRKRSKSWRTWTQRALRGHDKIRGRTRSASRWRWSTRLSSSVSSPVMRALVRYSPWSQGSAVCAWPRIENKPKEAATDPSFAHEGGRWDPVSSCPGRQDFGVRIDAPALGVPAGAAPRFRLIGPDGHVEMPPIGPGLAFDRSHRPAR